MQTFVKDKSEICQWNMRGIRVYLIFIFMHRCMYDVAPFRDYVSNRG